MEQTSQRRLPQIVAHRGYAARYPENTLAAIRAALAAGAQFVEFDIQLTRDGIPVLLHDESLERMTGRALSVFDIDFAELAGISAGEPGRFGERFQDERITSLAAVANELASHAGLTLFVELKRESIERVGVTAMVTTVIDALQPVFDRCVLISFEIEALRAARELADCRIGWALREWSDAVRAQAEELAPEFIFCNETRLPPVPGEVWPGPWCWVVYEIVEREQALRLAQRGVQMIETMEVGAMLAALSPGDAR